MRIVTLDIGGTAIKSGMFEDGKLYGCAETPTNAKLGGAHVMEEACSLIAGFQEHGFDAVGISTAGQVDPERGVITFANDNIPHYTDTQVKRIVEDKFHVPAAVENDVNTAALGELHFGAGRGMQDFLMVTIGTGVGGAAVTDGQIFHGAHFSAAEFGGIVTHPEDMREGEIFSGGYECYASASALVRRVQRIRPACTDGRKIFAQLADEAVRREIDAWIREIAAGLVTLTHIFDPSCIILGGGVAAQPYVTEHVQAETRRYLAGAFRNVNIVPAALGNRAGMYGAASLFGEDFLCTSER